MTDLQNAFRYHMRLFMASRSMTCNGYTAKLWRDLDAPHGGMAKRAIAAARNDVAAKKLRYPGPIRPRHRISETDGLRSVGRVIPDNTRGNIWDSRGDTGWHVNPYGDVFKDGWGLCFGVVYQLPGRNGQSRFVAGYDFGGCDGGPTIETSRIYTESQYQCAWRAGSEFAQLGESIRSDKAELKALLAERKAAIRAANQKAAPEIPTICRAIKRRVSALLESIADARKQRGELAGGDTPELYFWPGEARLQVAFCEGANLKAYPF
jgi:hypothetical protein